MKKAYSLFAAFALFAAAPIVALAEDAPAVQPATQAEVAAFLANPSSVLSEQDQAKLAAKLQALAMANSDTAPTLAAITSLSQSLNSQLSNPNNTPAQTAAIQSQLAAAGTGLGNAAVAVQASNPTLANTIQSVVAASDVPTFVASYSAATGGTQTAAAGGGGGGGVGGPTGSGAPSGGGGGGGGNSQGQNAGGNSGGGFTSGGGSSGGGVDPGLTSGSVSPH